MLAMAMNLTMEDEEAIVTLSQFIDPVVFGYEAGDDGPSGEAARNNVATADEARQALGMAEGAFIMLFGQDACEGSREMLMHLTAVSVTREYSEDIFALAQVWGLPCVL
jgi:hypothetical protein